MFNLAFRLLLARKKWLFLLVLSFALVISSIIAIYSSTQTIKSNLLLQSFRQYGEFSGVLLNVADSNEIKKSSSSYGEYRILDSYKINKKVELHIGWADNQYFNIGHISLKSGNLPMDTNEVAVESYYLESIDPTWEVNQTRTIKVGSKELPLKLVGIVENYSSRWTIRDNYYPNMFVFHSNDILNPANSNYLIKFKQNLSIQGNINYTLNLISNHGDSVINDGLLYIGLKDYENISTLSIALQSIILIVSALSIVTTLSFFNMNQQVKFAIFKALGGSNKVLYLISILQTTYVYILGILTAIPLILLLHYSIINNTYGFTIINENNIGGILYGTARWLVILYVLITIISFLTIKKGTRHSISKEIQVGGLLNDKLSAVLSYFNGFSLKQLMIQLLSHRKISILSTLTLSFSILLILLSVTLAKESHGIWNTKVDYYLDSQRVIGTRVIEGHNVIVNKGSAYLPDEVHKIESLQGIAYIVKSPYMLDIHTTISNDLLTPSIVSWIKEFNFEDEEASPNKTVIPNVKYVLKSTEDMSQLTSIHDREELEKAVVIYIPRINSDEKNTLTGKRITLSKTSFVEGKVTTSDWDFNIARIIDTPYKEEFDGASNINNEITIILDEQSAIDYGITEGYKELNIYTSDSLSQEESNVIYDKVYALTVGVPGSLFQYLPDLIFERTRLSDYLAFLGNFSFYISVALSISSISLVIFGKYRLQKRHWGIYRSLGLSTNKLFYNLTLELCVYYIIAIIISCIIYVVFLFLLDRLDYSLASYFMFYISTIFTVLLFLIAAALIIRERVGKDSISTLLKIEE